MRPWVAVAVAAAVAILAPSSPAQSLGEVAERTNKKKDADKAGKPAKVYTETDLRERPDSGGMSQMDGPAATPTASPSPGAAAPAGEKPKTPDEEKAEKQAEWRERLQHAESEVIRISGEVDRAQTALNDLTGPLYGGNRAAQVAKVDEGKRQIAFAQEMVATIQEEGRRAGYR